MTPNEFITEANDYGKRIWDIIKRRRAEPLVYLPVAQRTEGYIKCQRHHIIPRCWFRQQGLEIDNSEENVVNLLPGEHLEVHALMREYFKSINDMNMYYKMALAIDKLVSGNEKWIDAIVNDDKEKRQYLEEYQKNLDIAAEAVSYRFKTMSEEERQKLGKKISEGWDSMPDEEYDQLCKDRAEKKRANWNDPKSKMGSDEWRKNQSESQKRTWENKSEAEKILQGRKISAAYDKKSEEEKAQLRKLNSDINKALWERKTEKQHREHGEKVRRAIQQKSPEELREWRKHQSEALKRYHANKTPEQIKRLSEQRKRQATGRIIMSNDKLQITISCYPDAQAEWESKGYVRGNHTRRWKRETNIV